MTKASFQKYLFLFSSTEQKIEIRASNKFLLITDVYIWLQSKAAFYQVFFTNTLDLSYQ